MSENKQIAIDKVAQEFSAGDKALMVMLSVAEYDGLIRMVADRAYKYGWEEGMSDAKYSDTSKH